jgi:hypothetical protein
MFIGKKIGKAVGKDSLDTLSFLIECGTLTNK